MERLPPFDVAAWLGGGAEALARGAAQAFAAALNHLLAQDPAQRERLRAHAGAGVHVSLDAPEGVAPRALLSWQIGDDGQMNPAVDAEPSARIVLQPSVDAGFDALREGRAGVLRHLRIEGEPALVATLRALVATLRWDVEEDLSEAVGDAAARRLGAAVEQGRAQVHDLAQRVGEQFGSLRQQGDAPVVGRDELATLAGGLAELERRISALEGGEPGP